MQRAAARARSRGEIVSAILGLDRTSRWKTSVEKKRKIRGKEEKSGDDVALLTSWTDDNGAPRVPGSLRAGSFRIAGRTERSVIAGVIGTRKREIVRQHRSVR